MDIGEPIRHWEIEPFPQTAPVEPDVAPVTVPEPEPEKVPA